MVDFSNDTPAMIALVAAIAYITLFVMTPPRGGNFPGEMTEFQERDMKSHPYVGLWVTGDGHVRHELLPNGRYVEARGNREHAYEGRYEVSGSHIEYWDDTGFTADGDFRSDILHHAGMVLYRH